MQKNCLVSAATIGEKNRLAIRFPYRKDWVDELRSWRGATWDAGLRCWHVQDNPYFRKLLGMPLLPAAFETTVSTHLAAGAADAIMQFLRFMRSKHYSEQTIKTYTEALKCFFTFFAHKKVEEITHTDVIDFNNEYLIANKLSLSYQNQVVNALKLFFGCMGNTAMVIDKIHRPRNRTVLPNVLSKEEVKKLLESLPNVKHKTMLSLIYSCGLRSGELLALEITHVDAKRNLLLIKQAKGFKDRIVPLSNKTIELLRTYYIPYKPQKYLFEGQYPGTPYFVRSLQQVMKKAVAKAGIQKPATLHWLRHSYATHLLEAGTDLRYIQEILGHKSCRTTEIYTQVSTRSIKNITLPFDNL